MKYLKYFLVLTFVFTSCKTKKALIDKTAIVKKMSARKVARKHIAANFNKKSVDAKLKAKFDNGKLKQSISVSLRMIKDEVIWLKGSMIINVFKAKITPNSVRYYSPLAKNYFEGDFTMLKELLGVDINFEQLQNLLLGQSLLNVKDEKQNVEIIDKSYVLSPEKQADLFSVFFAVNPLNFKLDKQSVLNTDKTQRLDILYPDYKIIDGEIFPSKIKIKAKKLNKYTNIDFTLKSVKFDTDFSTNFSIPKGYKKIVLK